MPTNNKPCAVIALGMFDGVHMGHRALLTRTVEIANRIGCKSVAYTFSNHPRALFGRPPKLLTTPEERKDRISDVGIDIVHMEPFDRKMASLSPRAFLDGLTQEYEVRAVVVGFNYAFGQGGQGNARTLEVFGRQHGFEVHIIDPIVYAGETVSSTRIRELLESGDLSTANTMLCMPYSLCGTVTTNRRIGTSIGFPTANILPPPDKVLPKSGVYASSVAFQGVRHPAVTNIGDNPTVSGKTITIETHVLDFQGDLYDRQLCVELHVWLRDEIRFPGKTELAQQIERDAASARDWLYESQMRKPG